MRDGPSKFDVNSSLDLDGLSVGKCAGRGDEDALLDSSVVGQSSLATTEIPVNLGSAHATLARKQT